MTRTLVTGGRIVTAGQDFVGDILIEDGQIASVGSLGEITADEVIDAAGMIVFPGGVDPHTHLDTPVAGTVVSDDFTSGTIAAVVGGTTTIVDFAVQEKGTDPRLALEAWHQRASGKAAMDFAFHQIITDLPEKYLPSLDGLITEGVTSFKLFMAYPGAWMLDDWVALSESFSAWLRLVGGGPTFSIAEPMRYSLFHQIGNS